MPRKASIVNMSVGTLAARAALLRKELEAQHPESPRRAQIMEALSNIETVLDAKQAAYAQARQARAAQRSNAADSRRHGESRPMGRPPLHSTIEGQIELKRRSLVPMFSALRTDLITGCASLLLHAKARADFPEMHAQMEAMARRLKDTFESVRSTFNEIEMLDVQAQEQETQEEG